MREAHTEIRKLDVAYRLHLVRPIHEVSDIFLFLFDYCPTMRAHS